MPTNLQARYDLFCVKSAVKPQLTNRLENRGKGCNLCCLRRWLLDQKNTEGNQQTSSILDSCQKVMSESICASCPLPVLTNDTREICHWAANCYLRQGGYVIVVVCLSVC